MTDRVAEATAAVRRNVRRFRQGQQMTYMALSEKLDITGCHIPVLGLRRVERGDRRVEVGELVAFADVFGVEPARLLEPFDCPQCHGAPPTGFTCRTCGAPEVETSAPNGSSIVLAAPRRNLTDGFLKELAEVYMEAIAQGIYPAPLIADQTGAPVATCRRWVAMARKRGFLPEGTQGRAG